MPEPLLTAADVAAWLKLNMGFFAYRPEKV